MYVDLVIGHSCGFLKEGRSENSSIFIGLFDVYDVKGILVDVFLVHLFVKRCLKTLR